jgi:hypothetical protein
LGVKGLPPATEKGLVENVGFQVNGSDLLPIDSTEQMWWLS